MIFLAFWGSLQATAKAPRAPVRAWGPRGCLQDTGQAPIPTRVGITVTSRPSRSAGYSTTANLDLFSHSFCLIPSEMTFSLFSSLCFCFPSEESSNCLPFSIFNSMTPPHKNTKAFSLVENRLCHLDYHWWRKILKLLSLIFSISSSVAHSRDCRLVRRKIRLCSPMFCSTSSCIWNRRVSNI